MPLAPMAYHLSHTESAANASEQLVIGPGDRFIQVPRVDGALAKTLAVDSDNPWYSTDGVCLFSKDGKLLIRCLVRVERYEVPATCIEIDDEAFAYNTVIRHVGMHDGMTRIGDRAFIDTTLEELVLPRSMVSVGDEAFSGGKVLRSVMLNEGLAIIGNKAFFDNAHLQSACVPSTVASIGKDAFGQCKKLRASADNRTLFISDENEAYFVDDRGVLYKREDDGLVLVAALDKVSGSYEVLQGTTLIGDRAFAYNRRLQSVVFPETLRTIGSRAFVECERLTTAELPEGLVSIGSEAFYHSALAHVRIPSTLAELGTASLVVSMHIANQSNADGTIGGRGATDFYQTTLSGRLHEVTLSRFDVEVSPDNTKFSLAEGFLCEQPDGGGPREAMQFVGDSTVATVPHDVTRVAAYALFGVERVRELRIHTGIDHVGHSAFAISYPLDLVEVDDGESIPVRLYPAQNGSGTMAQRKAFRAGTVDLARLVRDCDSSLSFMKPGDDRSERMLYRLSNGRLLSEARQHEFHMVVEMCLDSLIRRFSRIDDRTGVRMLLDLGFIDKSNIAHAIEVANAAGGVPIARLLLEERRARFDAPAFDFDL